MKRRLIFKALALLLAVAICAGSVIFPIPTRASAQEDALTPYVILNRDFEDKTVVTNGFSAIQFAGNTIKLREENDNTYLYWVADSVEEATKHGHFNIDVSPYLRDSGSLVVRFKVKSDNMTTKARGIVTVRPYDYHNASTFIDENGNPLTYRSDMFNITQLKLDSGESKVRLLDSSDWYSADELVEVAYVFSWTGKTDAVCYAYYNGSSTPVDTYVISSDYNLDTRPCYLRFQVSGGAGYSWGLDDLQIYTADTTDPLSAYALELQSNNHGVLFNENAEKFYDEDLLLGSAYFKLGVERALGLDYFTVYSLTEAPFEDGGEVYIPTSALTAVMGKAPEGATEAVRGISAVSLSDIPTAYPGYYPSVHSSGLIALSMTENLLFEEMSESVLMSVMQMFLFEHIDSSHNKVNAFTVSGGQYTDHPYLLANQEKFDELRAVYLDEDGTADPVLKNYITSTLSTYTNVYKTYAVEVNGEYSSLNVTKGLVAGQGNLNYMPYMDDNGYDIGGRLNQSGSHTTNIMRLAYAYQITREEKYARLAYDYAVAIGNWEHWGPGHFLNCADAAAPYALAYDWLYDVWCELGLNVTAIEDIIFTHAVIPGYYSARSNTLPVGWHRFISGVSTASGWGYNKANNNWNAVCASGMVIAALSIVSIDRDATGVYIDTQVNTVPGEKSQLITETGDHTDMYTYQDYTLYMINQCFYGLEMYGLEQYMPDGSYIESNGYWSYGTNNLFEMTAAVVTATKYNTGVATDFGLLDAWGMDKTCYYAINTQSGDYQSWNYHDSSSTSAQDTSWFYFVGGFTGDSDLCELRNVALTSGKSGKATIQDIIFYQKTTGELRQPDLQYHMSGINGYVVRDSWDPGSIYAGIMGDSNNVTHGQIDSGSFVYYNAGVTWLCDLGTDNYNAYGFWGGTTRYRYYVMGAEGNNTLFLASQPDTVPYGQSLMGFGYIVETGDNDYGAYTVIDNTSVYGGYAKSAYRAMLMTNDRRTVVIQDEVEFFNEETAYWVAHTQQQIYLSVDRTVAYLYNGESVIRITLIDESGSGAHFEIEDAYTFHLEASFGMDELALEYYNKGTHELNKDRSSYKKLAVAFEGVTSVKLAAVIEEVAVGEICDVGYEWVDIADWNENTPTADGRVRDALAGRFDADGTSLGDIATDLGNLTFYTTDVDGSLAYVIGAGETSAASEVSFLAKPSRFEYASLGDRKVVVEFDLSTYSEYPEGMRLSITGKGGEIIGIDLSRLGVVGAGNWKRVTLLMDCKAGRYYAWFGDTLSAEGSFVSRSCEDLAVTFSAPEGERASGSVIIDDVILRVLSSDYTALDGVTDGGSIADWTDRAPVTERISTPLARVTYTVKNNIGDIPDTPIIDLFGGVDYIAYDASDDYTTYTVEVYKWEDLSQYLLRDAVVELYASNSFDRIAVINPITVYTYGYKFNATSSNYIARVDGDVISYERGSVTVTWVTESGSFTETYYGSVTPVSPTGIVGTTIYESVSPSGYEYYTLNGWSLTEGGTAFNESETVITTECNTFYQARRAYDGAFVTVKDGVITGYTNSADLFTQAVLRGGFDRVCLTSDIDFDSTGISHCASISVPLTIYLNGFTLDYHTADSSDHAFIYYSTFNIYGPGTITTDTTTANIFMGQNSAKGLIENVTVYAKRVISDHRGGLTEFRNCELNLTMNSAAFSLNNRNNVQTTDDRIPHLYFNGCRINMPLSTGSNAVFTLYNNSILELNDTEINVASGSYLVTLGSCTTGTVEGFDYANAFAEMEVRLGDVEHNCVNLAKTMTNDPSGATYPDMVEKIFYIEGMSYVEKPESVRVGDGYALVRQDTVGLPYVIVKSEDAVAVTWTVGGVSVVELWRKGSVPTPDCDEVSALTATAPDGYCYVFNTSELTGDTELVAMAITELNVEVEFELHRGFGVSFYVQKKDGITVTDIAVNGRQVKSEEISIDGVDYIKVTVELKNPSFAAEGIVLAVTLNDLASGTEGVTVYKEASLAAYAESVLASDTASIEHKSLVANALKYVEAAYKYEGRTDASEYRALSLLIEKYSRIVTVAAVERIDADMSAVRHALGGAALNLTTSPAYRLYIANGYTGTVSITYTSLVMQEDGGYTVTHSFDTSTLDGVSGVAADGRRYVDVSMYAFDLASEITLTVETEGGAASATYSLAAYYHQMATAIDDLTALVNAVYAYSEAARVYIEATSQE